MVHLTPSQHIILTTVQQPNRLFFIVNIYLVSNILEPSLYFNKTFFDDIQIVSCLRIPQCLNCSGSCLRKLEFKILKGDHDSKEGAAELRSEMERNSHKIKL